MTGLARSFFGKNGGRIVKNNSNLGITPLTAVQGGMAEKVQAMQTLPAPTQSNAYRMHKLKAQTGQSAETMAAMVADAEAVLQNALKMHQLAAKHQASAMKVSGKLAEVSADNQIAQTLHGTQILMQHAKVEGIQQSLAEQRRNELYGS